MKVTIITVCRNSARTIADALQSVRDQELPETVELEHVVVDGLSRKDNTVEIVKSFEAAARPRFTYRWVSEKDSGLYDAMNKGIRMASGEIIGILNSDDMMNSRDVVARIAKAAEDGTEVLYADVRFVGADTAYAELSSAPSRRYVWPRLWRPWMLSWGWTPPHPGLYIRKSAYEKHGDYLTGYAISSDDEIIVRLVRKCGASCKYVPLCSVAMRPGGLSTQPKNLVRQNREYVEMNRKNGYFCILPMMLPKLGIKALEIIVPKINHLFGGGL